jgi:ABC-type transporter Mla subunit MlaD
MEEPPDIPTARVNLSNTIEDTLALILERASQTGESALGMLVGLGAAELAQAVGFVGMDIAELLGQAEKVTRLYNAFRDFLNRAYESLIELLGRQLAQTSAEQVLEWVNELKEGASLNTILENFYETQQTFQNLQKLVTASQAQLEQFIAAIQRVSTLDSAYRKQITWAKKVLQALKWFGTLSTAVLPQGQLVLATFFITLGSYIILVGADYVDSPNLTLLNCVPGVRRVVEKNLAIS